jgi:hypothetical protein
VNWEIFGAWIAAGLTIFMYSFLYKDNPFYKIAEHLYIGASLGYTLVINVKDYIIPKLYEPLVGQQQFILLIPTVLGLLILLRMFPRVAWMSRFSLALLVGFSAGLAIPRVLQTSFIAQANATVKPVIRTELGEVVTTPEGIRDDISQLIILLAVLSVLVYFFFSIEHKGGVGKVAKLGIYFLMIYFGASYGATVMGRLMLSYGRIYDLYTFADSKYYYASMILLLVVAISLFLMRKKLIH